MHVFSMLKQASLPLLVAGMLLTPAVLPAFPQPSLSISSGNATGTYYAASSAIAKIFNRKAVEYGIRVATVASQGSVANIDSVLAGTNQFGIAETAVLLRAVNGLDPWVGKPAMGLRAVLGLHPEAVTIVAAADRGIKQVGDLEGKRLNIGAPGSSDHEYGALLLEVAGVPPTKVTLSSYPTALASEYLQRGDIDAYLYTVGHPNLSVLEASSGERKVLLLPFDRQLIDRLTAANPLLLPADIDTEFYPSLERQGTVPTVGVRAVLFTHADLAEETVYRLVREVMTNFDLFRRQHPVLQGLTPRDAAGIRVIPLHPGAERYFREAGITP